MRFSRAMTSCASHPAVPVHPKFRGVNSNCRNVCLARGLTGQHEVVAEPETRLKEERGPQTLEFALSHNSNSVPKEIRFVPEPKTVQREDTLE